MHCKDKMPKIWTKYSQKRNIGTSVPISTFMCLWANYTLPRWVCLFCWRKYVDWSWEYKNRSQTHDVEIGAEAALFPEKEYINGNAVAVCQYKASLGTSWRSDDGDLETDGCHNPYIQRYCVESLTHVYVYFDLVFQSFGITVVRSTRILFFSLLSCRAEIGKSLSHDSWGSGY
jgi:hypothetical protein